MKNGTFLKLNERLGPAVEVQSTSAATAELKDWSTWQLAVSRGSSPFTNVPKFTEAAFMAKLPHAIYCGCKF